MPKKRYRKYRVSLDSMELENLNSSSSAENPENPGIPGNPGNPDNPINPDTPDTPVSPEAPDLSGIHIDFMLKECDLKQDLPQYFNSQSSYPVTNYDFQHSESDSGRVYAMFTGDYTGVTGGPSQTLLTNMSKAFENVLNGLYSDAGRGGLVTAPFKIGAAVRFSDGSRVAIGEPVSLFPARHSPLVPLLSFSTSATQLHSVVAINLMPQRILFSLPSMRELLQPDKKEAVALDFYATAQGEYAESPLTVKGIYTAIMEDDERVRAVKYDYYEEEYVKQRVEQDSTYRVVGSLPVGDIADGVSAMSVALMAGALTDWKNMPKLTWGATGNTGSGSSGSGEDDEGEEGNGDQSGDDAEFEPYVHFRTPSLDLGEVDERKKVVGVSLCGIFPRDSIVMKLYGSHYGERWREVAKSRGGVMRMICGIGYPLWRVEIEGEMRPGDILDSLMFWIKKE